MAQYKITSSAGVDMGVYEGETPAEALDAMARDAGYESQANTPSSFEGTVEEDTTAVGFATRGEADASLPRQ